MGFIFLKMKKEDLNQDLVPQYYRHYVCQVLDSHLLEALVEGKNNFETLIGEISDDKFLYAYAEGKWSVAEVLLHIIDTERVFQYRSLRFARKDTLALPGFDQDIFVIGSNANERTIGDILEEFLSVRNASISLFKSFKGEQLNASGIASDVSISVAAMGFIICGHQIHHTKIIRDKYLQDI